MMTSTMVEWHKRLGILNVYIFAVVLYCIPLLSLAIFIIDQFTFNKTEMLFWIIFLLGMIPCDVIGLALSIIGLVQSLIS